MTVRLRIFPVVLAFITLIAFPFAGHAVEDPYTFRSEGLFGCSQTGAYSMSVGTISAIGGVYVPVNDAAVTVNSGTIVYKECILREVVDAMRMSAAASINKNLLVQCDQGSASETGDKCYVTNYTETLVSEQDKTELAFLNHIRDQNIAQPRVIREHAAAYLRERNGNPADALKCETPPQGDIFQAVLSLSTNCNPLIQRDSLDEYMTMRLTLARQEEVTQLNWGNGVRPVRKADGDTYTVLTPATLVRDSLTQATQSGYRQLENANDLGQMTGALYGALSTQIVSDSRGLSGILRSAGGQPSYLDQVVAEQAANVRTQAVNAAIQILAAAKQSEGQFLQIVSNIANILTQAVRALRSTENQCWGFIIAKTCAAPPAADNTCTSPAGDHLRVATSTAFSQAVIDAQITPLAQPAINNVNAAQAAVRLIDQLIASITNTNSISAQRLALQQLDSLVAQHKIHNQYDLQNAQSQQQAVQDSMTALIDKTKKDWADSTDPNVGWCNVNKTSVIGQWIQRWKI